MWGHHLILVISPKINALKNIEKWGHQLMWVSPQN